MTNMKTIQTIDKPCECGGIYHFNGYVTRMDQKVHEFLVCDKCSGACIGFEVDDG